MNVLEEDDTDTDGYGSGSWHIGKADAPVCEACGESLSTHDDTYCEACGHLDPEGIAVEHHRFHG